MKIFPKEKKTYKKLILTILIQSTPNLIISQQFLRCSSFLAMLPKRKLQSLLSTLGTMEKLLIDMTKWQELTAKEFCFCYQLNALKKPVVKSRRQQPVHKMPAKNTVRVLNKGNVFASSTRKSDRGRKRICNGEGLFGNWKLIFKCG